MPFIWSINIEITTIIRSGAEMKESIFVLFGLSLVTIATIMVTIIHNAIIKPVLIDMVIAVL